MSEQELPAKEGDLRVLPTTVRSRLFGWTLELATSTGLFAYGLYADSRLFMVLGFANLLYFAVWRMYAQFRGFRFLHSIYNKRLDAAKQADVQPQAAPVPPGAIPPA